MLNRLQDVFRLFQQHPMTNRQIIQSNTVTVRQRDSLLTFENIIKHSVCYPRTDGGPETFAKTWIPAFAGMTHKVNGNEIAAYAFICFFKNQ